MAILQPGKVVGDAILVADAQDCVAGRLQSLHDVESPSDHWVTQRLRYRREVCLPGTSFLLASGAGANYYHWLFDSLPRVWLAELAGIPWDRSDSVLLNQNLLPFHHQSLDLLGLPQNKRVSCKKSTVLRCEKLVVSSMPGPPGRCPRWIAEFLRERFLPKAAEYKISPKIFVSRRAAIGRRLINESELSERFSVLGFETVQLENLRFSEQIGLFARAKAVVAVHGAGLANLVFAPSGIPVVEIFSPTHLEPCYEHLARIRGLAYQRVVGNAVSTRGRRAYLEDLQVDVEKVLKALAKAQALHIEQA